MKKVTTLILALAMGALLAQSASAVSTTVRISQVYGGGGGSSTLYNFDYVELYNSSGLPVNIGGWAVEYGSPTGNWGSSASNIVTFAAGTTINACGYYLIQVGSGGTAGGPLPVAADLIQASGPAIGQTNGKVALFTTTNSNVACGSEVGLVDKVAFGTSGCPEGTVLGSLSNVAGAVRNGGGSVDTDNNVADFTVVSGPSLVPRNSSSPINPSCTPIIGACCQPGSGLCSLVNPIACAAGSGLYMGDGTNCGTPGVCDAVPAMKQTWGKMKTLYR